MLGSVSRWVAPPSRELANKPGVGAKSLGVSAEDHLFPRWGKSSAPCTNGDAPPGLLFERAYPYHSVEKKAAITSDATVAMATQVAGSAISAFHAMLVFLLDSRRQVRRHLPPLAHSESKLDARYRS